MKLIIGEFEYDLWDSVNYATLGALDDLQEESATPTFEGVTDPYIRDAFERVSKLPKGTPLRGQRDYLRALMGVVYLAKRRAGEDVKFADVRNIPYHDAKLMLTEAELAVVKADEKAPKESGAAESPEATP